MNDQKRDNLPKHQTFYINSFIDTFLIKKWHNLWRTTLLKMESESWNNISTWDLWNEDYAAIKYCKEWNSSLRDLLNTSLMKRYKNTLTLVIYIGHDTGRIEYRMLHEIFLKEIFILEGFVIIKPYYLALAINHDGGICVCQKSSQ